MTAVPVRKLLIAVLALSAGLALASPPDTAHAAPITVSAARHTGLAPQPAAGTLHPDTAQHLTAKDRPPLPADSTALHQDHRKPAAARAAAAACDPGVFTSRTGNELVRAIESAGPDCVNTLFSITGSDAHLAFQESQMTTVANALAAASPGYPGDDSTHLLELVLFLRAGYYVQWNDSADVGSYGTTLRSAIRSGLDAFYAAPHSQDVTEANGAVLSEAVTLIDSANEGARYLPVLQRLLSGYNSSYNSSYHLLLAVSNVYTVLFRGHQNPDFVAATEADPGILNTLNTFAGSNLPLLGGPQSYLESNAGTELARFLQDATLLPTVRPLVKGLLADSAMTGDTAPLWVGMAAQADQYDQADCAGYGTCDLANRLKAAVLTVSYQCGPVHIVAQALTDDQLVGTCASLTGEIVFFHNLVRDQGPVADDYNTTLEVDVFHSTADYQTYSGVIFGNSTDNGGEYLEGNPADPNNQARFVAYEADWLRPSFQIWNLNHEFTHYLDGRFDTYGDFGAATATADTIWWIEGLAEYDSYTYRGLTDTDAVADAAKGTYPLSAIFANTYNSGQDRVYPWGYLSVRYMLEKHRPDVDTLLGHYRAGDYTAALGLLNSIGTRYDADWANWLAACAAGACNATGRPPTASFTAGASGLDVAFADTTSDSAATITARSWDFGDGTGSTDASPSKTYANPGSYLVRMTVTDSLGFTAAAVQTVTVSSAAPECTTADTRELGRNCARSGVSADAGQYAYFYLYVPAGTSSLTITSTPGTGSADLYYSGSGWATETGSSASATGSGPHALTIANPPAGWNYLSLRATTAFSGATVTTRF